MQGRGGAELVGRSFKKTSCRLAARVQETRPRARTAISRHRDRILVAPGLEAVRENWALWRRQAESDSPCSPGASGHMGEVAVTQPALAGGWG